MKDTDNYIKRLISEGEHQRLDFKFEIADSKKIARSLVAFANTDGGRLLVGVKDNGAIAGVRSEEEFFMVEAAANMYAQPEVAFKTREWLVDGRPILEIVIPKSTLGPHSAPDKSGLWKVYVRVKDQNLLANRVLLKVWKARRQPKGVLLRYTDSESALLKYLQQNSSITLSRFCKLEHISRNKGERILVNYILLNVIEMQITDKGVFYRLKEKG